MPKPPGEGWGTWKEDRRYPSEDGTHLVVVSKRVDQEGKTHWKNERRVLSRAERAYYETRREEDESS